MKYKTSLDVLEEAKSIWPEGGKTLKDFSDFSYFTSDFTSNFKGFDGYIEKIMNKAHE